MRGWHLMNRATSLYAGRLPAITELPHHEILDHCMVIQEPTNSLIVLISSLVDDSGELDIWTPYHSDSLNLTKLPYNQYPPQQGHTVSCFVNSCKLSIIINDVIVQLYSRRDRTIAEASLTDIKSRLTLWRSRSPAHLVYDPDNLPSLCPPPHIICQKLV